MASRITASCSNLVLSFWPFSTLLVEVPSLPVVKEYETASRGEIPRRSHSASIHSKGVREALSLTSFSVVKPGPQDEAEVRGFDDVVVVDLLEACVPRPGLLIEAAAEPPLGPLAQSVNLLSASEDDIRSKWYKRRRNGDEEYKADRLA